MEKLKLSDVLTLGSFFDLMSDAQIDLPTSVWILFKDNMEAIRDHVNKFSNDLQKKIEELFPDGVALSEEEQMEADNAYKKYRMELLSEDVEVEFVTMSREKFEESVPSMKGVRGIYLFLKYIANEKA